MKGYHLLPSFLYAPPCNSPGISISTCGFAYTNELEYEKTAAAYWEGDIRIAWKPTQELELALVGQNLFNNFHKEMEQAAYLTLNTEVKRSYYLIKLSWTY